MSDSLADLYVRLSADTKEFNQPLTAAQDALKATESLVVDIDKAFSKASLLGVINSQEKANVALAKSQAVLAELQKAYDAGAISAETLARATTNVETALKRAGQTAEDTRSSFEKFADALGEGIEHPLQAAGETAKSFVLALGPVGAIALASGAALAEVAHKIADLVIEEGAAAQQTQNLADRLNLGFEETKKLSEMAQVTGVDLGTLGRVSMRLADALTDSAGSGKKVAEALDGMGITAGNSGELLVKVLEHLAEIPDATQRISEAHTIMGKGAVQLEPLLKNYASLSEAIDQLGGKLDSEMVAKLLKANEAARLNTVAWDHLKEAIAAAFAPAVTVALETITHLLAGAPEFKLAEQIAQVREELKQLQDQEASGGVKPGLLAGASGSGDVNPQATPALIAAKQAALDALESQKKFIDQSKEYNDEIDASNRKSELAKQAATEAAKQMGEWAKEYSNSILGFFTLPSNYDDYIAKLDLGGKTAKSSLDSIASAIEKGVTLENSLSGESLTKVQGLIDKLKALQVTAKAFADTDAFNVAAVKIAALVDKFPAQVAEITTADAALGAFFADMVAGAASVPDALNKIDIAALAAKVLEGQGQLDEQTQKLGQTFTKAWEAYETGARKAATAGQDLRGSLEDARSEAQKLADVPLAARLPADINAAYESTVRWSDALKRAGVDAAGDTLKLADLSIVLNDQRTTLAQGEAEWARVGSTISKLAQADLPAAMRAESAYVEFLKQHGAAVGQVYAAEEKQLQLEIQMKTQRGEDATAEIIALEQLRQKTEALVFSSQALGKLYVDLMHNFDAAFQSLGKGIADNIVDQKSWHDVWETTIKSIEKMFLETLIGSAFKALELEILKVTGLSKGLGAVLGGIKLGGGGASPVQLPGDIPIGGNINLGGGGGFGSGEVISEGGALPGGGFGDFGGEVTGAAESGASGVASLAGGLGSLGSILGIAGLGVSVASGIVSGIQGAHLNNLMGEVEQSTRGTLNQVIAIQGTLNTYLPSLLHIDNIWAVINTSNDHLVDLQAGLQTIDADLRNLKIGATGVIDVSSIDADLQTINATLLQLGADRLTTDQGPLIEAVSGLKDAFSSFAPGAAGDIAAIRSQCDANLPQIETGIEALVAKSFDASAIVAELGNVAGLLGSELDLQSKMLEALGLIQKAIDAETDRVGTGLDALALQVSAALDFLKAGAASSSTVSVAATQPPNSNPQILFIDPKTLKIVDPSNSVSPQPGVAPPERPEAGSSPIKRTFQTDNLRLGPPGSTKLGSGAAGSFDPNAAPPGFTGPGFPGLGGTTEFGFAPGRELNTSAPDAPAQGFAEWLAAQHFQNADPILAELQQQGVTLTQIFQFLQKYSPGTDFANAIVAKQGDNRSGLSFATSVINSITGETITRLQPFFNGGQGGQNGRPTAANLGGSTGGLPSDLEGEFRAFLQNPSKYIGPVQFIYAGAPGQYRVGEPSDFGAQMRDFFGTNGPFTTAQQHMDEWSQKTADLQAAFDALDSSNSALTKTTDVASDALNRSFKTTALDTAALGTRLTSATSSTRTMEAGLDTVATQLMKEAPAITGVTSGLEKLDAMAARVATNFGQFAGVGQQVVNTWGIAGQAITGVSTDLASLGTAISQVTGPMDTLGLKIGDVISVAEAQRRNIPVVTGSPYTPSPFGSIDRSAFAPLTVTPPNSEGPNVFGDFPVLPTPGLGMNSFVNPTDLIAKSYARFSTFPQGVNFNSSTSLAGGGITPQYNVTVTALDQSDQAAADTWRRVIRLTGGSVR